MAGHVDAHNDNWSIGGIADGVSRIGIVLGVLGLAAAGFLGFAQEGNTEHFYSAWLVNFCFFLSITLGGLFFVLAQHLTGATWSVVVRRLAEVVASNAWLMLLLFVPIVLGMKTLFPWANPEVVSGDHILEGKASFLNQNFFLIRSGIYFLVWILASQYFLRRSTGQDETGDIGTTLSMEKTAAPITLLFAVTVTFASFDYLMSLEPHWFSTIFGVYYFAGSFLCFVAFLSATVLFLQGRGRMKAAVTPEHYYDLGKWMFAFTVFWAYIGFSQYFLIWYANIPEETGWYYVRQNNGWTTLSWIMLIGHFIIPFLGLLPRPIKKNPVTLGFWAVYIMIMHWLDVFWIAIPNAYPNGIPFHPLYIACFLGMGGLYVAFVALGLKNRSLVPARDPRLPESLAFENA